MKTKQMTKTQLQAFVRSQYSGDQVFNLMVNFFRKFNSAIADELIEEDAKIAKMAGRHYMREMLDHYAMAYYALRSPKCLIREYIDGEKQCYFKRKEAAEIISHYMKLCKTAGCDFPDNLGCSRVLDRLNKWFCHYNEV